MESLEPKKLALIRIWQILHKYSDSNHPLTQEDICKHLKRDFDITLERKAISRNLSLLKEAGCDIASDHSGNYMESRAFEDSELRLLIDGVLQSKHITARHSADLIEKLCKLSNDYFRSHVKNVYSVSDWNKTENQSIFYNIELVDSAIETEKQLQYDYNKYDMNGKLQKTSTQRVSPYQLILHNQRYYLMGYNERWEHISFHRLDRMTNMQICDMPAKPIRSVEGYEDGIDFKRLASTLPYMYTDKPERIDLIVDAGIIDQVFDWFGKDIRVTKRAGDESKVVVSLIASPRAMEHWALQYLSHVEVCAPQHLRDKIRELLTEGVQKYL